MAIEKVVNITVKNNINTATTDVKALEVELKKAGTGAKDFSKELDKSGGKMGVFDQLKKGAQDLVPGLKGAESGMTSVIMKMWEMCANPLGLIIAGIVVGLKFLYEAFQSSVAGGKEIKAIWAGLEGVFNQGKDALFGLGRALINVIDATIKFITLDFKGAAESMKKANGEASKSFEQLGNAVDGTTFKIMRSLEKQQQANDKARKVSAVEESKANLLLVKSRDILMDETTSIKEKKKALAEVTKFESEASAERERIALKDLQIAKVKASTMGGEAEKKAKAQLRELEIAYNVSQTETAQNGIKLSKQRRQLAKQEREEGKAAADEAKAKAKENEAAQKAANDKLLAGRKEYLTKANKFDEDNNLLAVDTDRIKSKAAKSAMLTDLETKVAIGNQWVTEHRRMSDQEIADAQTVADAKKAIQDGMLNNIGAGLQLLGQLAGKNRALQATAIIGESALGIAKIIINTKAANAAARLKYALIPGGAALAAAESTMNTIGAGIGIAGNIAATAKALSALKAGGGASGGDGGRGSDGGSPQFNIVGQNSNNQLAQSIGKSQNRPVETFVVSGNMTTAQSLDRNKIATATFNG